MDTYTAMWEKIRKLKSPLEVEAWIDVMKPLRGQTVDFRGVHVLDVDVTEALRSHLRDLVSESEKESLQGRSATIEIPLIDFSASEDQHRNLTSDELALLHNLVYKLKTRNFDVAIPGWKYKGTIINGAVQPGSNDHTSLVLTVQF